MVFMTLWADNSLLESEGLPCVLNDISKYLYPTTTIRYQIVCPLSLLRTITLKCKLNPSGGRREHLPTEVNESQNGAAHLIADHLGLYI